MLIATQNQEGIRVIKFACDTCYKPIENLEKAMVVWRYPSTYEEGDSVHCRVVHCGPCDDHNLYTHSEELKQSLCLWMKEVYYTPDLRRIFNPNYGAYDRDNPRRFPNHIRRQIFKRDNHKCVLCGQGPPEAAIEADHKLPHSRGGKSVLENGQTLCMRCNRGKNRKLDHE